MFAAVVLFAYSTHGGFIDETIISISYKFVQDMIEASGESKEFAKCFVEMLKLTGSTSDVADLRNILNPSQLMEKLRTNFQISNFVCSIGGLEVLILIVLFFVFCGFLCKCCCRSKPKEIHYQIMERGSTKTISSV